MTTADKVGLIALSAAGIGTALFFILKRRMEMQSFNFQNFLENDSFMASNPSGITASDIIAEYNSRPNPWEGAGSIRQFLNV